MLLNLILAIDQRNRFNSKSLSEGMIMKNQFWSWVGLGIAGLVCTSFGEPFTLKEADHKQLLERGICEWDMVSSGLQPVRSSAKTPEGLIEPKIKSFFFADRSVPPQLLLFKSSAESKVYDRAILDGTGDGDFTDDPVLTLDPDKPVDVTWKPIGRKPVDYSIYLVKPRQPNQGNVAVLPKLWREGTITIEGKPIRALLQSSWMQNTLILDRDGDGKFNFNVPEDQLQLSTFVKINSTFYKTVQGATEDDWSLEPFKGPFGKLELSGEMVPQDAQGEVLLVLTEAGANQPRSRSSSFIVKVALTNQPTVIPAGEYMIRHANLQDNNPNAQPISFRMDKKLVLSPDQVTKLVLNKPKADISVTQKARTLTVRRVISSTGTPGITYSLGRDKEPLVVDVVDPADPAKVLIGRKNMEYG
jgi:hypothetical protein